mmetsp:Transcript_26530/g.51949  ORF Transcript_26530/g.51949 Transcript_26530/m.51949 type:complete len:216 (-) Transcript_26530:672-1319(-)
MRTPTGEPSDAQEQGPSSSSSILASLCSCLEVRDALRFTNKFTSFMTSDSSFLSESIKSLARASLKASMRTWASHPYFCRPPLRSSLSSSRAARWQASITQALETCRAWRIMCARRGCNGKRDSWRPRSVSCHLSSIRPSSPSACSIAFMRASSAHASLSCLACGRSTHGSSAMAVSELHLAMLRSNTQEQRSPKCSSGSSCSCNPFCSSPVHSR